MVRTMGKNFWCCKECESKSADLKSVLKSIETLTSEVKTIKDGQDEQQSERERVIEGLKVVEAVVKKIEVIESIQTEHSERLEKNESDIKKTEEDVKQNSQKIGSIEERLLNIDSGAVNVMQTNAIIRELREIEKSEKKLLIANLPESTHDDAAERKKEDEKKVSDVFKDLKLEHCQPVNVIRVGFGGRFPKKVLVILRTVADCENILQSAENTTLPNDIWLCRDRTWNQREEARMIRNEKERAEREAADSQGGRPRGNGKGPARPKKTGDGSVRGRGSRQQYERADSRKRRHSGEEDEAKWRRTNEGGRGAGRGAGKGTGRGARGGKTTVGRGGATAAASAAAAAAEADDVETQQPSQTPSKDAEKPEGGLASSQPGPSSGLGAAGGPSKSF